MYMDGALIGNRRRHVIEHVVLRSESSRWMLGNGSK